MKFATITFFTLFNLNLALASGCSDEAYIISEEVTKLDDSSKDSIHLEIKNDYQINLTDSTGVKYLLSDLHLQTPNISTSDIQNIRLAQKNGIFNIVKIARENVSFTFETDCSGLEQKETGRYEITISANHVTYKIVYPLLDSYLSHYGYVSLLPLFQ